MIKPLRLQKTAILLAFSLIFPQTLAVFGQQKSRAAAQQKDMVKPVSIGPEVKFQLTIDNIMRGPELVGYEPRFVRWSGGRIYFQWKQAGDSREKNFDDYVVQSDGSGLKKLSEEEVKNGPPAAGNSSKDNRFILTSVNGDIFLFDHTTQSMRQITETSDIELAPQFTRDPNRITFIRSNNLYAMTLDTGSLVQLTNIPTPGAAPAGGTGGGPQRGGATGQQRGTESQEFLKKEERELLDVVKRRAQKREEDEERRRKQNSRKVFQLPPNQSVSLLTLSPDGKSVFATVNESAAGAKTTIVPNYVTESGYTEDIPSRTNVGDTQTRPRLAILDVATGESKWVDHGQKQAAASGDSQTAKAGSETRDRELFLGQPVWSDDGTKAFLHARAADNKDRWLLALDVATGKTRVIYAEHDDAWVDGPNFFRTGWMKDNNHIYFLSERDGYSHLYTVAYDGSDLKQLTSGKWEVTGAQLSQDKTRFYLTTSEVHPGERHFYVMNAEGGERLKLTAATGNHAVTLSPDEKQLALIYSYSNKPPELYVQENRAGATPKKITSSPSPEFANYNWIEPPIVTFKARDGAEVYARLYKPANFKRGGPAVIFVHGAGYLQNVHRWWSSYFREYMFHHFLMENGYCVIDVDYRASSGYGRDWRTGIYRHMGGKDLTDQVDAARWLVSEHGVDAKRIGLYGGSYGGFITLMAMFTEPEVFAAGAALRPVTDWAHYNHGYTSNILNTPQKDAEAYKKSSPIYFAEGLKGALLICHGMVDVNVHFQDSVRLAQRLIELRKENWELAVYPVEDHGFVEPTSWADEYKRIYKLFQENLRASPKTVVMEGSAGGARKK
jgi:dipeptidyl aminopeptidase/acylaminoacyl peptidase